MSEGTNRNGGLRQVEFPVAGMQRRRIKALDSACSALLLALEAKRDATAAAKQAADLVQAELQSRELDTYLFVDGEQKFVATRVAKDVIKLVEVRPQAKKKRATENDEQLEGG